MLKQSFVLRTAVGSGRIEKEIKVFRGESLLTPFLFANFIGFLKGYFFFYFRSLPLAEKPPSGGSIAKPRVLENDRLSFSLEVPESADENLLPP